MNGIFKYLFVGGAAILAYRYGKKYYEKKKGIKTFDQNQLENIQKNCHLVIDEITGKKFDEKEIEELVIDITRI
jgi:DNA-binding transcriptional regulator YhcF (GntR family)